MLLIEAVVQRMDVPNILLVCLAGDVEKRVTIRLNDLNFVSWAEKKHDHLHGVHTSVDSADSCLKRVGLPRSVRNGTSLFGAMHPRSSSQKRNVQL